ncbi:hypothetical protein [Cryobacterium zhongshanensis]|uniref:Uncharacterized protein n=1 Tax=Cryobacterium zhongshanensis TaxID=2928153 RepID=A0AA41QVC7_9MICO|nr:hypothetical protein [Cryobacterium zhongshanensis]MCI4658124.1 hypothetical protein [Cryobacterium zhongshanensis]
MPANVLGLRLRWPSPAHALGEHGSGAVRAILPGRPHRASIDAIATDDRCSGR